MLVTLASCHLDTGRLAGQATRPPLATLTFGRNRGHDREPENMVDQRFTACRSAGYNFYYRRHANCLNDDISSLGSGSADAKSVGWLPEPPEGQPKLCELQAVRTAILPHAR